jgi:hypothetical protein
MGDETEDQYNDQEAKRRFEAAVRGAFSTPPKPMKDIPRKRRPQSSEGTKKQKPG